MQINFIDQRFVALFKERLVNPKLRLLTLSTLHQKMHEINDATLFECLLLAKDYCYDPAIKKICIEILYEKINETPQGCFLQLYLALDGKLREARIHGILFRPISGTKIEVFSTQSPKNEESMPSTNPAIISQPKQSRIPSAKENSGSQEPGCNLI